MITNTEVREAADAFRSAMAQGDAELADRDIEKKILQAITAQGAADLANWLITRVPNGKALAQPLEELGPALEQGNIVGKSLRSIQDQAFKQAKAIMSAAVLGSTWPVWISALLTFVLGIFGFAFQAGTSIGGIIIPLILGGGSALASMVRALQASAPALRGAGQAVGNLTSSVANVGSAAEVIYKRNTDRLITAFYTNYADRPLKTPIVGKIRGLGQGLLFAAFGLLAVCTVFFLLGLWNAYEIYKACPIVLQNGTCFSLSH